MQTLLNQLARRPSLKAILKALSTHCGHEARLVAHWQQGHLHHDMVFHVTPPHPGLPSDILVVSTDDRGMVKEMMSLASMPKRQALWHARCPNDPDFDGDLPQVLDEVKTMHWVDPKRIIDATPIPRKA
ncbi:MAG: hypothetical protein ACE366_15345 [Bradymonadia bacterium]